MESSIITVQLGQCGNTCGGALFDTLARNSGATPQEVVQRAPQFFRAPRRKKGSASASSTSAVARAVLVDMEPKVVRTEMERAARSGTWGYDERRVCCEQGGSGNNWAFGWGVHGPAVREGVLDRVRREMEACEQFGGFLLTSSMAGGTGSGVGSYVAEALREEHGSAFMMSAVVVPYESGEVIVQDYNALLSLNSLHAAADAIVYFENEQLSAICANGLQV